MIPVFTLSYSRLKDFRSRLPKLKNIVNYVIDNNSQEWDKTLDGSYYATSKNIGCAGGWNLICDIAFSHLSLDKIVITQDDLDLSSDLYEQAYEEATATEIVGVVQPFYEFSAFAITKDTWLNVGRFDENCLFVYGEDVDYKQRCYLKNIHISSLHEPNGVNGATIKDHPNLNRIMANRAYITRKWGASINPDLIAANDGQPPFQYQTPFDLNSDFPLVYQHTYKYENSDRQGFPSEHEYKRFLRHGFT